MNIENQHKIRDDEPAENDNCNNSNDSQEQDQDQEKIQRDQRTAMREMRRRKILQNAEERLARFGVRPPTSQVTRNRSEEIYPDPEVEPIIRPNFADNQVNGAADNLPNFADLLGNLGAFDMNPPAEPPKQQHFFFRWRLHIVLTSILAFILTTFSHEVIRNKYVFVYLGALLVVELLFFRSPEKLHPIIELLIAFSGVHRAKVERAVRLTAIFSALLSDLSISIFTVCCLSAMMSFSSIYIDIDPPAIQIK